MEAFFPKQKWHFSQPCSTLIFPPHCPCACTFSTEIHNNSIQSMAIPYKFYSNIHSKWFEVSSSKSKYIPIHTMHIQAQYLIPSSEFEFSLERYESLSFSVRFQANPIQLLNIVICCAPPSPSSSSSTVCFQMQTILSDTECACAWCARYSLTVAYKWANKSCTFYLCDGGGANDDDGVAHFVQHSKVQSIKDTQFKIHKMCWLWHRYGTHTVTPVQTANFSTLIAAAAGESNPIESIGRLFIIKMIPIPSSEVSSLYT